MYEPVIGMEVHIQLLTASKMFCGCSADYASDKPNTHTCPVCLGLPGALPVINGRAVELALMTGLALHCHVPEFSKWDRKNYPYPDLPKGYQISQYDLPLSRDGYLDIYVAGQRRRIGIRRAHLEEDVAKLTHSGSVSLIDFNRSGVPLLEVVTEPDLRSAEEARLFLAKLRSILRYLGVSTGNLEEGAMRCEANVSVREAGSSLLPQAHVEVKNLNSFRAVRQALDYEIARQTAVLEQRGTVEQVTMGWDEAHGVTVVQRSKEEAHDYRYFPEPDLPPLRLDRQWVEAIRAQLPELPDERRQRLMAQYGLSEYDADLLTEERSVADYYEAAVTAAGDELAKPLANWVTGPLFALLKASGAGLENAPVQPAALAELVRLVERGDVNSTTGRQILETMFSTGRQPSEIVAEQGLRQISDSAALEGAIRQVIEANPRAVQDYASGKAQALKFLVGQVMRVTRGQANPKLVEELLVRLLAR